MLNIQVLPPQAIPKNQQKYKKINAGTAGNVILYAIVGKQNLHGNKTPKDFDKRTAALLRYINSIRTNHADKDVYNDIKSVLGQDFHPFCISSKFLQYFNLEGGNIREWMSLRNAIIDAHHNNIDFCSKGIDGK
ncbi:hypothetical protein BPUTSESOX_2358 [uncultured Gammaproteobacteria bacterium]|jgi:hypothetical protein|nr:hypothetical protein [uncultured Gammaproteobacteria bacterium]CAC9579231.1 hypothetical protein [uncultured Gammaproteobacteria bacterium]VVH50607.1 hypothetical protein BPUTSESOX_2358 [uncultured Gammaproteobacteria bacterium]